MIGEIQPSRRDIRWVHLEWGKSVLAEEVDFDRYDEGRAVICGETFEVLWTYDGDGYTQMFDGEIDRYHALFG